MSIYICIDLKSFYASVECVERRLDLLDTNLVVADLSRTEKTICLAVTPSLKTFGIPGRARLFEVIQKVKKANNKRLQQASQHMFTGKSCSSSELKKDNSTEIDYIVAPPQMKHYMEVSTKIYEIYLRYIAPEDFHVYYIDEVFIEATLKLFDKIVNKELSVQRMYVVANHAIPEKDAPKAEPMQLSLFEDTEAIMKKQEEEQICLEKERKIQETMIGIKERYGKNAVLKGMNYKEGATGKDRNRQVGGHRA